MGAYSLAQAQSQLGQLVEAALKGEVVTITRNGQAVVTLTPAEPARLPIDAEYLKWLRKRCQARPHRGGDAVALVREMRDEER